MKSRKLLLGCGIALVLGLGIVLIGVIAGHLFQKQATAGSLSILVNINMPLNGAELPLNEPVSIYAEAVSDQPVHDLELWLDGTFSPTKMDSSPVDQSPLNATWLWTPTGEGVHRLVVRAIGPNGEVVNSNVVRVSALPREKISDLQVTPIPAEQLSLATPSAEATIQPPTGPTQTPPPPPFPPQDQPQVPAESPAGAPSLQGSINQCDATLLIQDNAEDEKGFYIYRFDPTSTGFTRVAKLDKYPDTGNFTYIDPGLSLGDHTYYIASFNGNGESASNLINVKVTDAQCAAASPQVIGLKDAILTTTKAVDKVYCYLSVNQGPWKRIPPGSNKFIYSTNGGFDLSKYLDALISPPPPGGVTLELECWGWSGGSLVYLGYLKQDVGKGPAQLIGTDFQLIGNMEISDLQTFASILSPNIAPPYSVAITNDLNKCKSILTGFYTPSTAASFCKQFLENGQSILSWKWEPGCPFIKPGETCPYNVKDIDGYHIYRVDVGGDPVQIASSTNGPELNFANITPTGSGVLIQPQYFVRAYKDPNESVDSAHLNGIPPKYTATLTTPKLLSAQVYKVEYIGGSVDGYGPNYEVIPINTPAIWVGYKFWNVQDSVANAIRLDREYDDAQIIFEDLSQIKGQVTKAILRWKYIETVTAGDGAEAFNFGCRNTLHDQNGAIIGNFPLKVDGEYDVTTQVRAWVQGLPNKGFAILSGIRDLGWEGSVPGANTCWETYSNFELEVTYTKK